MEWPNFHHLLYFWTVAREGSILAACKKLYVSQPTVSAQIRALERSLGQPLFARRGRRLELTDMGHVALRYADEIFTLGRELARPSRAGPPDADFAWSSASPTSSRNSSRTGCWSLR